MTAKEFNRTKGGKDYTLKLTNGETVTAYKLSGNSKHSGFCSSDDSNTIYTIEEVVSATLK